MASNLVLNTQPNLWSSAYDDMIYVFDIQYNLINSVADDGNGFAEVTVSPSFVFTPTANKYVYIDSGIYIGTWKITSATSTTVVLNVPYTANQTSGQLTYLFVPTFKLYKGFQVGENFNTQLPFTIVNTFTPQYDSNRQVVVNIRGLIQTIFEPSPPVITTGYQYQLFNGYRLTHGTDTTEVLNVLNSGISNDELNENYLSAGNYLTNVDTPPLWGCGLSFLVKFNTGYPSLEIYQDGVLLKKAFDKGFDKGFA